MTLYLIDTNVLSETSRPFPEQRVLSWLASLERPTLSVISLEEINYGIEMMRDYKKQSALRLWRDEIKRHAEFLPVTEQIAGFAGALRAEYAKNGRKMTGADALIAATALLAKRTLATRNVKNFYGAGIEVFNPFVSA